MAFTHSVCLCLLLTSLFSVKLYLAPSLILLSALPLELRMNDVSFTIFFLSAYGSVCFLCMCNVSRLALSIRSRALLSVCVVYVCGRERWGDEVVKPPPTPPTLSNQNETLNTSQSVKRAAKIETDPLFITTQPNWYSWQRAVLKMTSVFRYGSKQPKQMPLHLSDVINWILTVSCSSGRDGNNSSRPQLHPLPVSPTLTGRLTGLIDSKPVTSQFNKCATCPDQTATQHQTEFEYISLSEAFMLKEVI